MFKHQMCNNTLDLNIAFKGDTPPAQSSGAENSWHTLLLRKFLSSRLICILLGTVMLICLNRPAHSQCVANELIKLKASDGIPSTSYGEAVAMHGDVAVIGARRVNAGGVFASGATYVYRFDGVSWNEEAKLTAPEPTEAEFFGNAVAVFNDLLVIGAPRLNADGSPPGSAYVFRHDGQNWVFEEKLIASQGTPKNRFGSSVHIQGEDTFVGAYRQNIEELIDVGSVYVFRFNKKDSNWNEDFILTASDAAEDDQFGLSISTNADVAFISAYQDDNVG